jgi:hypothetical protein
MAREHAHVYQESSSSLLNCALSRFEELDVFTRTWDHVNILIQSEL